MRGESFFFYNNGRIRKRYSFLKKIGKNMSDDLVWIEKVAKVVLFSI
jgi:hypothetical protein